MRKVVLLIGCIATSWALAQDVADGVIFPGDHGERASDRSLIDNSSGPLINRENSDHSRAELAVAAEAAFFRRLRSGILSETVRPGTAFVERLGLTGQEKDIVGEIIDRWRARMGTYTDQQVVGMCSTWENADPNQPARERAESALLVYEALSPSIETRTKYIDAMLLEINSFLGMDTTTLIVDELEYARATRPDHMSILKWADGVRGRGSAVEQLEFTCREER